MNIIKVTSDKLLKKFIDFPHALYRDDSNYVPSLYSSVYKLLNKKTSPFFKHSEADYFLVLSSDHTILGRIAAIENKNYNNHHKTNVGFFGFFDCVNSPEVARLLLDEAESWILNRGLNRIIGPANFSTNETAGLLIEGFDSPPVVEMTYNYPYYQKLIEQHGYVKDIDMYAFFIPTDTVNTASLRLADALEKRLSKTQIHIENLDKRKFDHEVKALKEVYRGAWSNNWGFVPPSDEEFERMANELKDIIEPQYTYIAKKGDEYIGFAVGVPNINETLRTVKKGRLFPFGFIKLLMPKRINTIRIILLGVTEKYRNMGIEATFFARFIQAAKKNNLIGGEASWILENNTKMIAGAEKLNGKKYKTYRMYTKHLS